MKIDIVENVLQYNKDEADKNRKIFKKNNILVFNLLSSPGAGKTSLIIKTIEKIGKRKKIGVIEGDISSTHDSKKIKKYINDVVQINTGGTCHLNASMVAKAIGKLKLEELDIIFIENVGNLICPVSFDLGEDFKVVISSVNEGDDKPIKYPPIFIKSNLVVLNKIDMLAVSDFNSSFFSKKVKELNPNVKIIKLSCQSCEGLEDWINWIINKS
ncbi:MAG: hydrogenase nickel incorporation protein HypB [Actinobacteria bacterium]|nr:hydrogenase nickel incorporation protein HypB [Actinomycetota bacterium]MBL7123591.1 hydrogenase nickel incorporation protein HypB [Actinomycetota bacterium]